MKWVFLLGVLSCGKPPTEGECRAMLDRYVDMTIDADSEIVAAPESARPALREIKKEQERDGDSYKNSLRRCTREVSRREWNCAMQAPNPNQWEACF